MPIEVNESNFLDYVIRYEEIGDLSEEELFAFFQHIYDTEKYRWLQGHYGRTLRDLLEAGKIRVEDSIHTYLRKWAEDFVPSITDKKFVHLYIDLGKLSLSIPAISYTANSGKSLAIALSDEELLKILGKDKDFRRKREPPKFKVGDEFWYPAGYKLKGDDEYAHLILFCSAFDFNDVKHRNGKIVIASDRVKL